jgi:hypothetical protein
MTYGQHVHWHTKLLNKNMNTTNNNTEILLQVKKLIGLEINIDKIHKTNVPKPTCKKVIMCIIS